MQIIRWIEGQEERSARWCSLAGSPPPRRVAVATETLGADQAYRLVCEGTALLWHGGYPAARQLLTALARRVDTAGGRTSAATPAEAFHLHRRERARRARLLGMVLVPYESGWRVPLRKAPQVREACEQAYGPAHGPAIGALRELLGAIGAYQWRTKGVHIPALDDKVHPHYGVFSPVRGEYVDLVAQAPLPSTRSAFDIGTGTGVLAAVLARRGLREVVATDQDPRAVACAQDNLDRLGLARVSRVECCDLFPAGRASLIVCNPPWLPGRPRVPLDHAIYDPGNRMLLGFLRGLSAHLQPGGEGWLILSDLAERLGLRTRDELLCAIDAAGLRVADRLDTRPRHPRAADRSDPLYTARAGEITSLWRLTPAAWPPAVPACSTAVG